MAPDVFFQKIMWSVVHFSTENAVEVVPSNWIVDGNDGKECFWPPFTGSRLRNTICSRESPGCSWKVYRIAILGEYDDYKKAQVKCIKAKETDKLSSSEFDEDTCHLGRGFRNRKNRRFSDYDTDDDDIHSGNCIDVSVPVPVPPFEKTNSGNSLSSPNPCSSTNNENANTVYFKQNLRGAAVENNKSAKDRHQKPNNDNFIVVEDRSTTLPIKETPSEKDPTGTLKETLDILTNNFNEHIQKSREFQRQVIRQLYIINARLKEQGDHFDTVMKKTEQAQDEAVDEDLIEKLKLFPIADEECLKNVETSLKMESKLVNKIAKEFALVGGDNVKEVTKRILYRILTNEIASLYSFEGFKGKKVFKHLNLYKVIIQAVRYNHKTKDATEKDIICEIKNWLAGAKFRINKKCSLDN